MKKTILISVRGGEDHLPAKLAAKAINQLRELYPDLPITLAYESPNRLGTAETFVVELEDTILARRKRSDYTILEQRRDLALDKLLKSVRDNKNVNLVLTDLSEDARAKLNSEELHKKRTMNIADNLRKIIEKTGGIVIDFGNITNASRIQRLLENHSNKHPIFKSRLLQTQFYCVYSEEAKRFLSLPASIQKEDYPFDLKYIATKVGENGRAPTTYSYGVTNPELNSEEVEAQQIAYQKAEEEFMAQLTMSAEMLVKEMEELASETNQSHPLTFSTSSTSMRSNNQLDLSSGSRDNTLSNISKPKI